MISQVRRQTDGEEEGIICVKRDRNQTKAGITGLLQTRFKLYSCEIAPDNEQNNRTKRKLIITNN